MFFLGNVATINKRRRHTATPLFVSRPSTAILGVPGSGKSQQLLLIATQLMRKNYGLVYFGSREILEYVPPKRRRDVVYFNPADADYPMGLNLLDNTTAAVGALKSIWWDEWGTLIDSYTFATCAALSAFPNGTILAINRMLLDYKYRKRVLSHVMDIGVRNYWTKEFTTIEPRDLRNQIQSTLNKIRKLINDPLIRNIIGQRTSFKLNKRTIFIADFSAIGHNRPLLASLALAHLSQLNVPFLLDEPDYGYHTIPRLSQLIMTLRTLPDQHSPLRTVVENAHNLCCFQLGLKDATALLPAFDKTTKLDDLLNLRPLHAIANGERISVPDPIGARRDPTPIINRSRALSPGRVVVEDRLRRFLA